MQNTAKAKDQTASDPLELYESALSADLIASDAAQREAVEALQELYGELFVRWRMHKEAGLLGKFSFLKGNPKPVQGLYFWGGVGRGKTWLMDLFYESIPFRRKMRVHFHRFMRRVHKELKQLEGSKDPLDQVADGIAQEAVLLCFDEFFVSDITDAMILGTLLDRLFERGVTLVATSNIPPERLYENGLQRERFLPAIRHIQSRTRVLNVDGGVDYRLRALTRAELYHYPLDEGADASLQESFNQLAVGEGESGVTIDIEGRPISCRCLCDDVAWFDFEALCDGPRSQNDYIELSREFHTVLLSNVPCLSRGMDDQARRFINLVDEFYDRRVNLVMSAEVPLESLYQGSHLGFEFQRTTSRLLEMQSEEYLAQAHQP
jgi:cell division protein ZapE